MRLSPFEILQNLGFDVPEAGIEISADDAFYHISALNLIGKTLNAQHIPDEALIARSASLPGLQPELAPLAANNAEERADRTRASMRATLKATYGITV